MLLVAVVVLFPLLTRFRHAATDAVIDVIIVTPLLAMMLIYCVADAIPLSGRARDHDVREGVEACALCVWCAVVVGAGRYG